MDEIYLAKSDLTGAIYAVRGRSKTNVTEFVTDLIKVETADLTARLSLRDRQLAKAMEAFKVLAESGDSFCAASAPEHQQDRCECGYLHSFANDTQKEIEQMGTTEEKL